MRCPWLAVAVLGACSFNAPTPAGGSSDAPGSSSGPPSEAGGCPDDDGDGVCNDADACPGSDDHVDSDGDGIPDGCDDWPCGVKPSAPGPTVMQNSWKVESLKLANGSPLYVVKQATDVTITAKVSVFVGCGFGPPLCDAQVYYGSDPGGVAGCMVRGVFANGFTETENITKPIRFDLGDSSTPKVFDIKAAADGFSDCPDDWPFGTPNAMAVIGKVCVTP